MHWYVGVGCMYAHVGAPGGQRSFSAIPQNTLCLVFSDRNSGQWTPGILLPPWGAQSPQALMLFEHPAYSPYTFSSLSPIPINPPAPSLPVPYPDSWLSVLSCDPFSLTRAIYVTIGWEWVIGVSWGHQWVHNWRKWLPVVVWMSPRGSLFEHLVPTWQWHLKELGGLALLEDVCYWQQDLKFDSLGPLLPGLSSLSLWLSGSLSPFCLWKKTDLSAFLFSLLLFFSTPAFLWWWTPAL